MKDKKNYSCDERILQMIPGAGFYTVHADEASREALIEQIVCFGLFERYMKKIDEYETSIEPMVWADDYMQSVAADSNLIGVFSEAEVQEYNSSQESRIHYCIAGYFEEKERTKALQEARASK